MHSSWSRRKFLGVSATAVGAATLGLGRLRAADDAQNRFAGFNLGLQSYTLRGFNVDRAIEITSSLGLHSIEFFDAHFPVKSTDEQIETMKKKTSSAGIKILGHGVNGFSKDHEANRRYFEFAKKAGIRNLSADPSEDAFDSLDKLCEEYDVRIAIHNHGPGARYNKVTDVLNAVKGHHKNIGACADLGHYIRSGEDPVKVVTLLEGRLFGVHLKDFKEPKANTQGVILGKGQLDVEGVFRALKKVNFPADGCLSLEYEENEKDPIADVTECVAIAAAAAQKAAKA